MNFSSRICCGHFKIHEDIKERRGIEAKLEVKIESMTPCQTFERGKDWVPRTRSLSKNEMKRKILQLEAKVVELERVVRMKEEEIANLNESRPVIILVSFLWWRI